MNRIKLFLTSLIQALFSNPGENRLQSRVFLYSTISLYIAGLWIWTQFFRYGNMMFRAGDWYKEYAFYSLIRQSFVTGNIPYHTNLEFHGTNRFLSLPELIFSPQIFVLKFTDNIGLFVLIHILLLFTVGFIGCVALQREFKLSTFSFTVLVSLFTFNGYITSHLAVGHTMWGGYFFLPWMFLVLILMTEGRRSDRTIALWLAMILSLIWLQGSLHIFVGCLIYLVLFAVCNIKYMRVIALSFLFIFILSFLRILPAIISFNQHYQVFESGIPTVRDLVDGLTMIKYPSMDMIGGITGAIRWWEVDFFIGVLAFLFVLYFGIYKYWKNETLRARFCEFTVPNIIIAILAMNHVYYLISKLPIPMASVERIPARLMIIPLVSILLIACVSFDEFCRKKSRLGVVHLLALGGLVQTLLELMTHLRFWNVTSINAALPAAPVLKILAVSVPNDQFYIAAVKYSFVVSAFALVAWIILLWWPEPRERAS